MQPKYYRTHCEEGTGGGEQREVTHGDDGSAGRAEIHRFDPLHLSYGIKAAGSGGDVRGQISDNLRKSTSEPFRHLTC